MNEICIEKFLEINIGMSLSEVERILQCSLGIDKVREAHFKSNVCTMKNHGISFFFKPDDNTLYTIKYESPFPLPVNGVFIGDTTIQVEKINGNNYRKNPFPSQDNIIWIYGSQRMKNFIRFDFDKVTKKCITIFK